MGIFIEMLMLVKQCHKPPPILLLLWVLYIKKHSRISNLESGRCQVHSDWFNGIGHVYFLTDFAMFFCAGCSEPQVEVREWPPSQRHFAQQKGWTTSSMEGIFWGISTTTNEEGLFNLCLIFSVQMIISFPATRTTCSQMARFFSHFPVFLVL